MRYSLAYKQHCGTIIGMIHVLGRILLICWSIIFAITLILVLMPNVAVRTPRPVLELAKPFLLIVILISLLYAVAWLFRHGMNRLNRK